MSSVTSPRAVRVGIVGVGLVGNEVLRMMLEKTCKFPFPNPFRTVGVSNSKITAMVPAAATINNSPSGEAPSHEYSEWLHLLSSGQPSNDGIVTMDASPNSLVDRLAAEAEAGHPALLIDCTSDLGIVEATYVSALRRGVSVVTPNKKGLSSSDQLFKAIVEAQASSSSRPTAGSIYFESTVGAGLPIINTLRDLLITGDKILRVEGIFSGTLSYIFNQYAPPIRDPAEMASLPTFSEIVRDAQSKGYTEPNPAEDLCGMDFARKLVILSRIIACNGHPTLPTLAEGYASLQTMSLVPSELAGVSDKEEFMRRLPSSDEEFDRVRQSSYSEQKVTRYVGCIDATTGTVATELKSYPMSHPFANLSGSDNIISFTTQRYPNPLIIRGAGAGAAVTAMGVVADAIRVAQCSGIRVDSITQS